MMIYVYDGTEIETDEVEFGRPVATESGPRCGNCKERHAIAKAVRFCYEQARAEEEQAKAEYAAELAAERYYEDRGYDDARAQEEYEARNGVIPFDVAYAEAMGYSTEEFDPSHF